LIQLNFPAIDPAVQAAASNKARTPPPNLSLITSGEQPIPNLDLPATSRPAMADLQANNPDGRPSPR